MDSYPEASVHITDLWTTVSGWFSISATCTVYLITCGRLSLGGLHLSHMHSLSHYLWTTFSQWLYISATCTVYLITCGRLSLGGFSSQPHAQSISLPVDDCFWVVLHLSHMHSLSHYLWTTFSGWFYISATCTVCLITCGRLSLGGLHLSHMHSLSQGINCGQLSLDGFASQLHTQSISGNYLSTTVSWWFYISATPTIYLRDGHAWTVQHADTLRQRLQIERTFSSEPQKTDTGPTIASTDPLAQGVRRRSQQSANV